MGEELNLKHFITEELFLIPEEKQKTPVPTEVHQEAPIKENSVAETSQSYSKDSLRILVFPMNQADKALLIKLLAAIKMTEKDVRLMDAFSGFNANFNQLLSFGYQEELNTYLGSNLNLHEIHDHNGQKILITKPLSSLHDNRQDKEALWKCLQEMFLQ